MSRLVDPSICPDCRGPVDTSARCRRCGLVLSGPSGDALWRHMLAADGVIEQIRREQAALSPVPVGAVATPAGPAGSTAPATPTTAAPAPPPLSGPPRHPLGAPPAAAPAGGLSGKTVPALLLGLGGLFVLVAVSLFLAVTWTLLPLAVKAVIMVGFTVGVGTGAAAVSRRGLRGSAEALWALTAGLLVLDLSAAWRSGPRRPRRPVGSDREHRPRGAADGPGCGGRGRGPAYAAAALRRGRGHDRGGPAHGLRQSRSSPVPARTAPGWWSGHWPSRRSAVGLRRLPGRHLREVAALSVALGGVAWLLLVGTGADLALGASDRGDYWSDLLAWRLVVAAALIAMPTLLRRLQSEIRVGCATASLACLALAALWRRRSRLDPAGAAGLRRARRATAGLAVLPRGAWSTAAALLAGLGAVGRRGCVVVLAPVALTLGFTVDRPDWSTPLAPGSHRPTDREGWTLLVLLAAGLLATVVLPRHLPTRGGRTGCGARSSRPPGRGRPRRRQRSWPDPAAPLFVVVAAWSLTALLGLRRLRVGTAPPAAAVVGAEAPRCAWCSPPVRTCSPPLPRAS